MDDEVSCHLGQVELDSRLSSSGLGVLAPYAEDVSNAVPIPTAPANPVAISFRCPAAAPRLVQRIDDDDRVTLVGEQGQHIGPRARRQGSRHRGAGTPERRSTYSAHLQEVEAQRAHALPGSIKALPRRLNPVHGIAETRGVVQPTTPGCRWASGPGVRGVPWSASSRLPRSEYSAETCPRSLIPASLSTAGGPRPRDWIPGL